MLVSIEKNFLSESQDIVVINNNFPSIQENKVDLFFTKDPSLLNQYYKLRESAYREMGFEKYSGRETSYDRNGDILLAVMNGEVVGGARLDFSDQNKILYNEQPEVHVFYKDILKSHDNSYTDNDLYAEICSLVIRKDFRNNTLLSKMYNSLLSRARFHGCKYLVGVSYSSLCRHYEVMFKKLKYNFKILYDVLYPFQDEVYGNKNHLKLFPIFIKLQTL